MSERVRERSCERKGEIEAGASMSRSLSLKLQEKEESPPHPYEDRTTKKVKIRSGPRVADSDMLSYDPITSSDDEMPVEKTDQTKKPEETLDQTQKTDEILIQSPHPEMQTPKSFKDMLLNHTSKQKEENDDLPLHEGDVRVNTEGIVPSISFSDRVHRLLNESMKHAIVIKMLGRNIRYTDLRDRVVGLWKLIGPVQLIDLENNCFIAKLDNEHDYNEVLLGGPWVIFGHYLTIQTWTPEFSPLAHMTSQVMGWVRIPGLPTKYYKKSIIRAIGEVLGKVLKIDYNTASGTRGKFARMAVLIDLSKPLTSKIEVDGRTLYIDYIAF